MWTALETHITDFSNVNVNIFSACNSGISSMQKLGRDTSWPMRNWGQDSRRILFKEHFWTFCYHSLYKFTGVTEHSQNDVHNATACNVTANHGFSSLTRYNVWAMPWSVSTIVPTLHSISIVSWFRHQKCTMHCKARIPWRRHRHSRRHPREDIRVDVGVGAVEFHLN